MRATYGPWGAVSQIVPTYSSFIATTSHQIDYSYNTFPTVNQWLADGTRITVAYIYSGFVIVQKLNADGTRNWVRTLMYDDTWATPMTSLYNTHNVVDASGHVYVAMTTPSAANSTYQDDVILAKLNGTDGTVMWGSVYRKPYAGASTDGQKAYYYDVAPNGDLYFTTTPYQSNTTSSGYLTKYNTSGTWQWTRKITPPAVHTTRSVVHVWANNTVIYLTPAAANTTSSWLSLVKYSNTGTISVQRAYSTNAVGYGTDPRNLLVNENTGDVFLVGVMHIGNTTAQKWTGAIVKANSSGTLLAATRIHANYTNANTYTLSSADTTIHPDGNSLYMKIRVHLANGTDYDDVIVRINNNPAFGSVISTLPYRNTDQSTGGFTLPQANNTHLMMVSRYGTAGRVTMSIPADLSSNGAKSTTPPMTFNTYTGAEPYIYPIDIASTTNTTYAVTSASYTTATKSAFTFTESVNTYDWMSFDQEVRYKFN